MCTHIVSVSSCPRRNERRNNLLTVASRPLQRYLLSLNRQSVASMSRLTRQNTHTSNWGMQFLSYTSDRSWETKYEMKLYIFEKNKKPHRRCCPHHDRKTDMPEPHAELGYLTLVGIRGLWLSLGHRSQFYTNGQFLTSPLYNLHW